MQNAQEMEYLMCTDDIQVRDHFSRQTEKTGRKIQDILLKKIWSIKDMFKRSDIFEKSTVRKKLENLKCNWDRILSEKRLFSIFNFRKWIKH